MKPIKFYLETSIWNFYFADDSPERCVTDPINAVLAMVNELDALFWNMKHLTNYRRLQSINAINLLNGYNKHLDLITPMEVSKNEN